MKEDIVFDIVVDGKPARKSLQDIKKDLDGLEQKTDTAASSMKMNWTAIGATIAAAATASAVAMKKALDLEKAMYGLTQQTKDYIKFASQQHGMSQDIIAGFVQSGRAAGMAAGDIEKMIDQAVALGRMYPHESTETFIDNLVMLNRTGEAQGFIVDVLEQNFKSLDAQTATTAEKLAVIEEVTKGVNDEFNRTSGAKVDQAYQSISNEVLGLASSFNRMIAQTGILDFLGDIISTAKQMVGYFGIGLKSIGSGFVYMKATAQKAISDILFSMRDIPGIGDSMKQKAIDMNIEYNATIDRFKQIKKEIKGMVKELNKVPEEVVTKPKITGIEGKEAKTFTNTVEEKKALDEVKKAHEKTLKDMEKETEKFQTVFQDAFRGAEDSIVQLARNGKMEMGDMFNSILEGLLRIQIRQSITQPLSQAFGAGASSFFGSMFAHAGNVDVHHSGHIPSHHNGSMRSDERLAKLQVGESVISRHGTAKNKGILERINRGESVGGGGVVINIENNTGNEIQQDTQTSFDGETLIVNTVLSAMNRNKNGMRDAIRSIR